jgi:tetratricopeptide (TPR) repeat protein
LEEEGSQLAIYGLGGCGKTALALESAYWMKEQRPTRAVFWVPAISRESFEQAYYEIAKCLGLPGIQDPQVDIMRLVKAKLSEEDFGSWLIIVDNADNTNVLFDNSKADRLIDCLPQSRQGSVIFTTRTRAAAMELAQNNVMALGELQRGEAVDMLDRRLLQQYRQQLSESGTVNKFLEMLYFHALAIVQAIAFINTNDVTLSDYINLYRNSEGDAMDLLKEEFQDQGRYQEATNSVATTWYISFERIQRQNAIAADHLFFMACTANNDVAASMFPQHYTKTEHVKAMGTLKAHSFIAERQPRADSLQGQVRILHKKYDVHPLVHLAIRGWLKAHRQWTTWVERTLTRLIEIVPYGDHDTRDYWTAYMHHAMHLISLPDVHDMEGRMTLLERIGRCERSLGKFQVAERAYRQAFEQRLIMSGEEHPNTLMTMGNIAIMLGFQGKWVEAEEMHREELRLVKKALGEKHPQTLATKGNLALAVLGQWKYAKAEEMYRELLLLDKEVLGEKHLDTVVSIQNLGGALRGQGRAAEAEQLHREALALTKEIRGNEHADTLSSLSVLGSVLRSQCKYAEAETIHREELMLRKKVLGEEHPDTVKSMHKLGDVLCAQEKYKEAEQIQRAVLAICEKESWDDRRETLIYKSAMAHTLHNQGRYAEAEQIHRETLATKEKSLGTEHQYTVTSVYWLAEVVHNQTRYEEALALYERAYAGLQNTLGPENTNTKECLDLYTWVKRIVEEQRAAEVAKAEEAAANDIPVTTTSTSMLSDQRTSSMGGVSSRLKGKWRARLHQIVKKSGS